jgi:aminocarboxymuconate-semialdehyde decarboxylase
VTDEPRGVDVHAHAVPRSFLEQVARSGLGDVDVARADGAYVLTFPGKKPLRPVAGIMLDFEERLHWLDEEGMERQLVAPWLDVHGQDLDPKVGREWVRSLNDCLAEEVASTGGRVQALATLHLADGKAAAEELARAVEELGMRGCMLPTNVSAGALSDAGYEPLWEAAESLGAPVTLHPPTVSPSNALFRERPAFKGVFGRLIDTTVAAADLVVAGVLDRYPDLRLVLVHGGGFLPYQTGRFDREFGGSDAGLHAVPSEYVRRLFYDTVLMSPDALGLLFSVVGSAHVVIGSDYAAGPKYRNPGKLADALFACTDDPEVRAAVLRENADRLYAAPATEGPSRPA